MSMRGFQAGVCTHDETDDDEADLEADRTDVGVDVVRTVVERMGRIEAERDGVLQGLGEQCRHMDTTCQLTRRALENERGRSR